MFGRIKAGLLVLALAFGAPAAKAGECGPMFDLVFSPAWQCIFPMSIGGIINIDGEIDDPDPIKSPICVCGLNIGLTVGFWEPARVIDTVADPWCLNALGMDMPNPAEGQLGGRLGNDETNGTAFQQMHYYVFPIWGMLDLFLDLPCLEAGGFDIAMMSELVPTWNDELLAFIMNPEAVLFGNPYAQMACAADAVAALEGLPTDELFWCMGSWGSAYPLAGTITSTDYVEANAGLAARSIYMMGRTELLADPGVSECGTMHTPVWKKQHYRLQLIRPTSDYTCHPIGEEGLTWTGGKHAMGESDNFSWLMFRKVECCMSFW